MCENIISNFIGAFFGFIFAILIEVGVEKKADKDMQSKVKGSLNNELDEINNDLKKIIENNSNPLYFRYQFIAWKTCVNSGYLFSVSGKAIYNMYVKIYTDIEFADNLEQRFFELATTVEKNDLVETTEIIRYLDEERIKRRKIILEDIENILKI